MWAGLWNFPIGLCRYSSVAICNIPAVPVWDSLEQTLQTVLSCVVVLQYAQMLVGVWVEITKFIPLKMSGDFYMGKYYHVLKCLTEH